MSVNKNALARYQTLDRCFRNPGRMYFWEDLLNECNRALVEINDASDGIQRRQLFEDIRFMESEQGWSVQLRKIRYGRRVYYRYEDISFSINNQPLNNSEVEKIKAAVQILSRFSGAPQFEWISELIPMLSKKFGLIQRDKEVICFDTNIDLVGLQFIDPIFNAITNKRVLEVCYKDFKSSKPNVLAFHPYYLKQYNNRWFVFGYNPKVNSLYWNLALDRIESIVEKADDYHIADIDWEDYFYDIVGVTRPEGVENQEVILRFLPSVAPYVISKPIHPSQINMHKELGVEVKINVIPNIELENLILSFGEQVEVVSPKSLRERISERVYNANLMYGIKKSEL